MLCRISAVFTLVFLSSQTVEARVGRTLFGGEIAFTCRSSSPAPRREYFLIQNNSAIEQGRASRNIGTVVMISNDHASQSTAIRSVEARLKKDKNDSSFIDFIYETHEALRINTGNPGLSELVVRKQDEGGATSQQAYPLACTTSKVAIHSLKTKKKNYADLASRRTGVSLKHSERQPARAKLKSKK